MRVLIRYRFLNLFQISKQVEPVNRTLWVNCAYTLKMSLKTIMYRKSAQLGTRDLNWNTTESVDKQFNTIFDNFFMMKHFLAQKIFLKTLIIAEFISFEGCFKPGLAFQVRHLYGTICPLILIYILHYQYLVGHDRLSY